MGSDIVPAVARCAGSSVGDGSTRASGMTVGVGEPSLECETVSALSATVLSSAASTTSTITLGPTILAITCLLICVTL